VDISTRPSTVIVVTGGEPVPPGAVTGLPDPDLVVAADSGLEHASALGLSPDVVVGDMDSVAPGALAGAERAGALVERHPVAKDATDLELALRYAAGLGPARIVVTGGTKGRFDHELANVLLLCADDLAGLEVDAWFGPAHLTVVRSRRELCGEPGDLVSLLPVGGPALGVRTDGLLYPLAGEDLGPGTTRGVSNVLTAPVATVSVESGVLLAVQPGGRA
jgi:thiamine pyrophosphokinase